MPTGHPTKLKACSICGEMFLPKTPSTKICNKEHHTHCPICGSDMIWNTTRPAEPCSRECKKLLRKQRNLEKYGCEHPMQNKDVQAKHRQTMRTKYGVDSPLQSKEIKDKAIATNHAKFGEDWAISNQDVREKRKITMIERYGSEDTLSSEMLKDKVYHSMQSRYGVTNPSQSSEIRTKTAETNLLRYGAVNPMQNDTVAAKASNTRKQKSNDTLEKAKATWLDTLGVDNPSKSSEVLDKMTATFISKYGVKRAAQLPEFRDKMIQTMIQRYGVPYYCQTEEFKSSNHFRISKINQKFSDRLTEEGISHELEYPVDKKIYDFYLPDQQVVIEINPTYTHNIIGNHWNSEGLDPNYHRYKSQLAESHDLRCIHVWDWDNWDKIINMLKPTQRLFARDMKLYKLNLSATDKFLQAYHLQGSCKGQLLCLGLVKDDMLYQVMTFGKPRYSRSHSVELLRLCTKPGYTIVGGASKLFKYATHEFELHDIISYCDASKFSGDVYSKIGMQLLRQTAPQEIWSKKNLKITANLLRQRGYDQLFNTNHGKGTSNEQLMLDDGWLPIFDCGQRVYEF